MRHSHLSEVELAEYADGEMSPRRLVAAEAHLGRCDSCARSLAGMRQAAAAVGRLTAVPAPAGLRQRIMESVRAETRAMLSCREAAPMMHEHLDGCLSPLAACALERHLRSCARCRAEMTALVAAARLVRLLPSVQVSARVRAGALAAYRRGPGRAPAVLRWRPALAAAVAALVVGALAVVRLPHRADRTAVIAQMPREVTAPTASPIAAESLPAATVAMAAPNEVQTKAEELAAALVAPTQAEPRPVRPRLVVQSVPAAPKGPAPARTVLDIPSAGVALPAGLAALRATARSASHDWEVRRAMEMAGERFATLGSEELYEAAAARLPAPPSGSSDGRALGRSEMPAEPEEAPPAQDTRGGQHNSTVAPAAEGASLLNLGPFV